MGYIIKSEGMGYFVTINRYHPDENEATVLPELDTALRVRKEIEERFPKDKVILLSTDNKSILMERQEEFILKLLNIAFRSYCDLSNKDSNENRTFTDGIHFCQQAIALRTVRKHDPGLWRKSDNAIT